MSEQSKDDRSVCPGDRLAAIEEFLPMRGTFEVDGEVRAAYAGTAKFDKAKKQVSVVPANAAAGVTALSDVVIGQVSYVRDTMAFVDIWKIGDKSLGRKLDAALRIENSSPRYEDSMYDVCRLGDLVRARVIDTSDGRTRLSTSAPGCGVIKALCSRCGSTLALSGNVIKCPQCDRTERRRYAVDYGKESAETAQTSGDFLNAVDQPRRSFPPRA